MAEQDGRAGRDPSRGGGVEGFGSGAVHPAATSQPGLPATSQTRTLQPYEDRRDRSVISPAVPGAITNVEPLYPTTQVGRISRR